MNEREFQRLVQDTAKTFGWLFFHARTSIGHKGRYQTAMDGNKGFPDCVMVRGRTLIFAELKSDTGTVSKDQQRWLDALERCEDSGIGPHVYVWRPKDYETEVLPCLR